jgi:hypothetical protein
MFACHSSLAANGKLHCNTGCHGLISAVSWITSGWGQTHRTSPRRVGRRCGKTVVMRSSVRAPKSGQIGIWQHDQHPTMRWTSASIGECWRRRFLCVRGAPACATAQKPAHTQRLHYGWPSSTQTTEIKGARMPQTRVILNLMCVVEFLIRRIRFGTG